MSISTMNVTTKKKMPSEMMKKKTTIKTASKMKTTSKRKTTSNMRPAKNEEGIKKTI